MNKDAKQKLSELLDECEFSNWVNKFNAEVKLIEFIDALEPDHPKVMLPLEVGKALEDWKANNQDGYGGGLRDFCGDMHDEIFELGESVNFAYKSEENYCKVIDAFHYGWEVEPEAKWYVLTPKEWWEDPDVPEYIDYDSFGISNGLCDKELAAKFTRAELKKYHLDSDIFTLVAVEEEK